MVNDCAECQSFDARTKELMNELFSIDETTLVVMMIAWSIQTRTKNMKTTSMTDSARIQERINIDMMTAMLGKFMVSFESDHAKVISKTLLKSGIAINLNHAACPHGAITSN